MLAVCVIHWERVRGCRSSVFLFFFWLLGVICSLIPLHTKVQLAVDQVREMTTDTDPKSGDFQFHGTFTKPWTNPAHMGVITYWRNTGAHMKTYRQTHAYIDTYSHLHKKIHRSTLSQTQRSSAFQQFLLLALLIFPRFGLGLSHSYHEFRWSPSRC